jgi:NADPH2 dehydrogenase
MESISRYVFSLFLGLCLTNPRADMGSSDPIPQFSYLVRQLRKYNLAYLHVTEPRVGGNVDVDAPPESSNDPLRQIWCEEGKDGVFISAGGYTRQTAIETAEEKGGMVAFGRLYIPNVSSLGSLNLSRSPVPRLLLY